jgi:hypothetical protein
VRSAAADRVVRLTGAREATDWSDVDLRVFLPEVANKRHAAAESEAVSSRSDAPLSFNSDTGIQ